MRLKQLMHLLAFALCVQAFACHPCLADTLTMTSTGGQVAGGVYVYPYNLNFDGASQTTPMMCINYNDEVTFGETWQVTGQQVSTASSVALQEDAWLFSQLGTGQYSNADLQFAVWDILDPGVGGNSGFDTVAQNLVTMAQAAVPGLTNSFLNRYTVLSPVTSQQAMASWTAGLPQSFIVTTSAVTPEPSSLLLLGTGLAAASLLLMRRRALQEQRARVEGSGEAPV